MSDWDEVSAPPLSQDWARVTDDTPEEKAKAPSVGDVLKQALGVGGVADTARAIGYGLEKVGVPYGTRMRTAGDWLEQELLSSMTPGGRQGAQSNVFEGEGFSDLHLGDDWGKALLMGAARSAPQMVVTAPVGGPLARGTGAVLSRVPAIAAKMAPEAEGVLATIARNAPAGVGFGAAEGLQAGAQNAAQTESQIEAMSTDELMAKSPRFRDLAAQVGPDEAKRLLADEASKYVFTRTVPATGGIGALTGGGAMGELVKPGVGSVLKGALKGAAEEAAQEIPQSGEEQLIQNLAEKRTVNPEKDPMSQVLSQALTGGAIALPTGGAVGGAAHVRPRSPMDEVKDALRGAQEAAQAGARAQAASAGVPPAGPPGGAGGPPATDPKVAALKAWENFVRQGRGAAIMAGSPAAAEMDRLLRQAREAGATEDEIDQAGRRGKESAAQTAVRVATDIKRRAAALAVPPTEGGTDAEAVRSDQGQASEGGEAGQSGVRSGAELGRGDLQQPQSAAADVRGAPGGRAAPQPDAGASAGAAPSGGAQAGAEAEVGGGHEPGQLPVSGQPAAQAPKPTADTELDLEAHQAAPSPLNERPEPTPAQARAGNYKKGHIEVTGMDISVENPAGSVREDKAHTPPRWRTQLRDHYGYIRGTVGHDKDHLDAFVRPGTAPHFDGTVYVVNQGNDQGSFDEHKVMIGYASQDEARKAYLANYDNPNAARSRLRSIVAMPMQAFKDWAFSRKNGPSRGELVLPTTHYLDEKNVIHAVTPEAPAPQGVPTFTSHEAAREERRSRLKRQAAEKKSIDVDRDSITDAIMKLGGINMEHRLDITGDDKAQRSVGGVGHLFTKAGTGPDDMATLLGQHGYLTKRELADVDGGVQALKDKVRADLAGDRQMSTHRSEKSLQAEEEARLKDLMDQEEQAAAAEAAAEEMGADLDMAIDPDELRGEGLEADASTVALSELVARAEAIQPGIAEELDDRHPNDADFRAAVVQFLEKHEHPTETQLEEGADRLREGKGEGSRLPEANRAPSGESEAGVRQEGEPQSREVKASRGEEHAPLFIPLKTEYFEAFERGDKDTEYRKYGGQWTEKHVYPGRKVVLSKGYGKQARLTGTVVEATRGAPPDDPAWKAIYGHAQDAFHIKIKVDREQLAAAAEPKTWTPHPYPPASEPDSPVRKIVHGIKGNDAEAIARAAREMAKTVSKDDVLVPIPGHNTSGAENGVWRLAHEIGELSGAPVIGLSLRTRGTRQSQYVRKKRNLRPLSGDELQMEWVGNALVDEGKRKVWLVDNVLGSGETMKAAQAAVGRGEPLVYAEEKAVEHDLAGEKPKPSEAPQRKTKGGEPPLLSTPEGTAPPRDVEEQKVPTQQLKLLEPGPKKYDVKSQADLESPGRRRFIGQALAIMASTLAPTAARAAAPSFPVKDGPAGDAVRRLAESSANPIYRELAKRVLPVVDDVPVRVIVPGTYYVEEFPSALRYSKGATAVSASGNRVRIFLRSDKGQNEETVMHEALHAATQAYINQNPQAAPVRRLKALMEQVERALADSPDLKRFKRGPLADVHEFMAWGMTDPEFQGVLRGITVEAEKTAWKSFVDVIARMLGVADAKAGTRSALEDLLDAGLQLIEEAKGAPRASRGGREINHEAAIKAVKWEKSRLMEYWAAEINGRRALIVARSPEADPSRYPAFRVVVSGYSSQLKNHGAAQSFEEAQRIAYSGAFRSLPAHAGSVEDSLPHMRSHTGESKSSRIAQAHFEALQRGKKSARAEVTYGTWSMGEPPIGTPKWEHAKRGEPFVALIDDEHVATITYHGQGDYRLSIPGFTFTNGESERSFFSPDAAKGVAAKIFLPEDVKASRGDLGELDFLTRHIAALDEIIGEYEKMGAAAAEQVHELKSFRGGRPTDATPRPYFSDLAAMVEQLETYVDRAYEAGSPHAEDLDAMLADMKDELVSLAEQREAELEEQHDAEVDDEDYVRRGELDQVLRRGYLAYRAGGGEFGDREGALGNMRSALLEAGARPEITDEQILAGAADAHAAALARDIRRRVKTQGTVYEETPDGPTLVSRDVAIVQPSKWQSRDTLTMYEHTIMDVRSGQDIGRVTLVWQDGKAVFLPDIRLWAGERGKGRGEAVIRALLEHNGQGVELAIGYITDSARAFWRKMGARIEDTDEGTFGTISLASHRDERGVARRAPAQPGGEAERSEPPEQGPRPARAGAARRGIDPAGVRARLVEAFGPGVGKLEQSGLLKIVANGSALPDGRVRRAYRQGDEALYDPADGGAMYMIASGLRLERVVPVFLHELGEHHGLKDMLGYAGYQNLLDAVQRGKVSNPVVAQAWDHVLRRYPELTEGGEQFVSEVVARVGESDAALRLPWFRRVLAAVREWLVRMGLRAGLVREVSDRDLVLLVTASARRVMAGAGVRAYNAVNEVPDIRRSDRDREAAAEERHVLPDGEVPGSSHGEAPVFYSELERKVEALDRGTGTAAEWKAAIANLQGVKKDEIEWSGITDWLDTRQGQVSKDEVLGFLRNSGVRVTETMLGEDTEMSRAYVKAAEKAARLGEERNAAMRNLELSQLPEMSPTDRANLPWWGLEMNSDNPDEARVAERKAREVGLGHDQLERLRRFGKIWRRAREAEVARDELAGDARKNTQYDVFALPGGKNYRELLLTLPPKEKFEPGKVKIERHRSSMTQGTVTLSYDGKPIGTFSDDIQLRGLRWKGQPDEHWIGVAQRRFFGFPDDSIAPLTSENIFRSGHFVGHPNILAHVRFDERSDAGGKKVLFIEELQSDWAEQGRKRGFQSPRGDAELPAGFEVTKLESSQRWKVYGPDGRPYGTGAETREAAIADALDVLHAKEVPTAPFVGKTEAWVSLLVKRLIRYAADHGFDRIAWTTGAQQNERYNLRHHVQKLRAFNRGDGTFDFMVHDRNDRMHDINRVATGKLEETVGKDLAEKIAKQPPREWRTYEDLDLRVGGEGMLSFYDKIVPNVVNDVLKKLGGARVREIPLQVGADLYDDQGNLKPGDMTKAGLGVQPGFDLTPTMKEKALGGLPMFSRGGEENPQADMFGTADDKPLDLFTLKAQDQLANRVKARMDAMLKGDRKFNWWHRTIGTQLHKALTHRVGQGAPGGKGSFGAVFWEGQAQINDTSRFSMQAEEKAPDILLRLEGPKGLLKRPPSKSDLQESAKALFAGTLWGGPSPLQGKVFTDDELRRFHHLSDRQIGLYRQVRAAVDDSVETMGKSVIARLVRGYDIKVDPDMTIGDAAALATEQLKAHAEDLKLQLEQVGDELVDEDGGGYLPPKASLLGLEPGDRKAAKKLSKRVQLLEEVEATEQAIAKVGEIRDRVAQLQKAGYMPLMRFGQHYVTVTDVDGEGNKEVKYFGMYESQYEANRATQALHEQFPGAYIERGLLSKDAWRIFRGVSPETIELFADIAGLDEHPLMQKFIQLAASERSALKRLLERKGTPGWSWDIPRALAQFVTSNARAASGNYHHANMLHAIEDIPEGQGDVKDEAVRLYEYLTDPQEEAGALRGYLFFHFLGGSVASMLVNMTQPILVSAPFLNQYANVATVTKELLHAMSQAGRGYVPEDAAGHAMRRAMEEGIVAPHEIYQLMAEARGGVGRSIALRQLMRIWGGLFSLAEAWNRRSTFLAAYRIAEANQEKDPYGFAVRAVHETQFIYNKGNRPDWSRGPVGATLFTFKQFSISYMEFLKRLPMAQRALALGLLALAAGLNGMPGADDLDDILDTLGQWMGYATNTKEWKREALGGLIGEQAAQFVLHGASTLPGMPLDVQMRLGLGNLIPGTSIFKPSTGEDKGREISEVLGPAGGIAKAAADVSQAAFQGDLAGAAKAGLPKAVRDAYQALEMWETGEYRDRRGRRVIDSSALDGFVKLLGFNPSRVAEESRRIGEAMSDVNLQRETEQSIADEWAKALADEDDRGIARARQRMVDWNERNPDLRVVIKPAQLRQRVRELRATREERFVKRAAPEIRGRVADQLRD